MKAYLNTYALQPLRQFGLVVVCHLIHAVLRNSTWSCIETATRRRRPPAGTIYTYS
jgi:hypothetical protein